MAFDSFLVLEAEGAPPQFEEFRKRHINHPGNSVPLHTTLVSNLCSPDQVTQELIRRIEVVCSSVNAFDYQAVCVNAFPANNVLWLAPMPVTPFELLVRKIYEAFPHTKGLWPFPSFHMTIGLSTNRDEMTSVLDEFQREFANMLPLKLSANEVSLWTVNGDNYCRHSKFWLGR